MVIRNLRIYPRGNWVDRKYSKKRNKAIYLLGWVIGDFRIEGNLNVKIHPHIICIYYDGKKENYKISIEKKVFNYSAHLPRLKENGQEKIIILPSQEFIKKEIQLLQHIEAFGSIDMEIYDIDWGNISIEWIPESEQEEKELLIKKYDRSSSFDGEKQLVTTDWLFNTIIHQSQLEHLTLPFSFFRSGLKYYKQFQFQESFLNFYLMLEGVFGDGKFENGKIKREFKKSPILLKTIRKVIEDLKRSRSKHYEWLILICKKYNKELNEDGVIHTIVEQRGNLSHFSIKTPDKNKNPFKDREFDSLAYISLMICRYVSIDLRLEPYR